MKKINFLYDTEDFLAENGYTFKDVLWFGSDKVWFTVDEFLELAGCFIDPREDGMTKVPDDLILVGKNFWGEYTCGNMQTVVEASWRLYKIPTKPKKKITPFKLFRTQGRDPFLVDQLNKTPKK
jgi:hypothetical protein